MSDATHMYESRHIWMIHVQNKQRVREAETIEPMEMRRE